ncbi:MAG: hypothetical protein K6F75_09925 [Butyrivibrio sp.]|nr:hypothetical protein [Butyrivibrio sp.]
MSKTTELYYESAYLKEFEAEVVSCTEVYKGDGAPKDKEAGTGTGKFEVVLNRTAFFPEQGGQSSDVGVISVCGEDKDEGSTAAGIGTVDGGAKVSHVSIDKEGVIRHVVDRELPVGSRVYGLIDFSHRFSNMQQHTGEHIFSGIVHSEYGFDNVGFHLSDAEVTMDYNGVLGSEDIKKIEYMVNRAIWENIEVLCRFPSKEELDTIDYRSKKELTGDIRIVTIPGYDDCACCAPHVERTGEIGLLKVISCQNYKGGVRVSILCGGRALSYIQSQYEIVTQLSGMLTTSADKIIPSLNKMREENADLKARLNGANEELIGYQIAGIDADQKDVFLVKDGSIDQNVIRKTVNALIELHSGYCGVFAGDAKAGYRFIIGSGSDGKDCKALLEKLKQTCDVKGGGSPQMIQGSIQIDNVNILELIDQISGNS